MSEPTSSSPAHAEGATRSTALPKAPCGPNCGPDCTCDPRVTRLERTVRRIRFWLWVALFIVLMALAFFTGQKLQTRRGSSPQTNRMNQPDRRPPMQSWLMPKNRMQPWMNKQKNHGDRAGAWAPRFRDNRARGPNGGNQMTQPSPHDGDVPAAPPPPQQNAR